MAAVGFELRVGGRVWLDGRGWEVAELDGATVRLLGDGRLRPVSVASLASAFAVDPVEGPTLADGQPWTVLAVVLAALSSKQRDALQRQVAVLRQVLEPPAGDDRPVADRYGAAAAQLGVTRRTLERQLARLREQGPAGLVDARKLQDLRRTVDPRWDVACREVLDSFTSRSNPTMQTVID